MSLAFTSDYLCSLYAQAEIEKHDLGKETPSFLGARTIAPLVRQLSHNQKLDRRAISRTSKALLETTLAQNNVLAASLIEPYSVVSNKYSAKLCAVQTFTTSKRGGFLEVIVYNIRMDTATISAFFYNAMARIYSHALERYMSRTHLSPESFYRKILRPLKLAIPLALVAYELGLESIYLPIEDGMVIATIHVDDPPEYTQFHMFRGRKPMEAADPDANFVDGKYRRIDLKTFIDEDSINIGKGRIIEKLIEIETRFSDAIDMLFQMHVLGSSHGPHHQDTSELKGACHRLMTSPDWLRLVKGS